MRQHSGTTLEADELSPTSAGSFFRPFDVGELATLAAAGDERAWRVLVDRFTPMLWSIARGYRLSPADAADVMQVTWLRLTQHLPTLRQPEHVAGWLATTARRESLAVIRRARREEPTPMAEHHVPCLTTHPGDADDGILRRERDEIVRRAVLRLPPRQQMLLRLLAADPPPNYRDISDATGIPIGSIGPTRARALRRLRQLLAAEGLRSEV
jgi:RNA polymerase sigma factor (sigma-70 family)